MTGYPTCFAHSIASPSDAITPSDPGRIGRRLSSSARALFPFLAHQANHFWRRTYELIPQVSQTSAKFAFSDSSPYPG